MKLLLTGFEPFGKQAINVSEQVVLHFQEHPIEGVELHTAVLPVDRFSGPDQLLRLFMRLQPDTVICLGQAGGKQAIAIERVAVNLLDFLIPDNGGNLETDKSIQTSGDAAYFATLPVRKMVTAVQNAGIPVQLSLSAGTFLCNQVMYEMLHYIHKFNLSTQAGFIHLPLLPEQVAGEIPLRPSMSLDAICKGVRIAIETLGADA